MLLQEDSWSRRSLRLTRQSGALPLIGAGLLFAATVWAQAGPASEQLRRARELALQGKPEQAITIYQELIQTFPNSPDLLMDLSIAQCNARHYRDSIEHA